jgi:acylpyruvate hydrolase
MKLTTIRSETGTAAARVDGTQLTVLPFDDVGALLASGGDWRERAESADGPQLSLEDVTLAPLTPKPEKIICVGLNYRDHAEETGQEIPEHPTLFAKYARCLMGPDNDLVIPAASSAVDWEIELGVIIGSAVRNVGEYEAQEAIAGYTIINDVSMRDWQTRTSQYLQGKTFESSTPIGPFLVTPDEIDHARDLSIRCSVDGKVMQDSTTANLVFSPAEIVAYISTFITLMPGDVIATGTPGGVGAAQKPALFLQPGQVLESTIEGLGEQRNHCVAP